MIEFSAPPRLAHAFQVLAMLMGLAASAFFLWTGMRQSAFGEELERNFPESVTPAVSEDCAAHQHCIHYAEESNTLQRMLLDQARGMAELQQHEARSAYSVALIIALLSVFSYIVARAGAPKR